jgi:LacI family transcriptional regulator
MVARIQAAISRLKYIPNMSARALVNNSSRIIGVINHLVPLESGGFFQDPFHGALLAGIEQTLRERGYYLMVRTIDNVPELLSLLSNWNLSKKINGRYFMRDALKNNTDKVANKIIDVMSKEIDKAMKG